MHHGRFTDCSFLRAIGRNLLEEFFTKFDMALPVAALLTTESDDAFFSELSRLLLSPEGLPDEMNEVLHEIHELSTTEGHDRLKAAIGTTGLQLSLGDNCTPEELALRVWLSSPALLTQKYNEQRFTRLKTFVYFEKDRGCLALDSEVSLDHLKLDALVFRLDTWFAENGRGNETVLVEKFTICGEHWYLIRHGDTYLRSAKIEKRKVEALHYRPAKDDLVVYSPERDELRINAKTKGEHELYRTAFGYFLHGFENYFREMKTYSLEPLRDLGAEALECDDVPGIAKVVLKQLELEFPKNNMRKMIAADDVFACEWAEGEVVPQEATLKQAAFTIYVEAAAKPVEIRIKPPNVIRLGKQSGLDCVHQWLSVRGFRRNGVTMVAA